MKKKVLLFSTFIILSFICGVIASPFFREKTYQIKEWTRKTTSPPPVSKEVILYFSDSQEQLLVPVKRRVFFGENVSTINDQIRKVLEELIKGPETKSLSPTLPENTKIRAVYTRRDVIYIDFNSSLTSNHPGGASAELVSVYSVVNTLLENFPLYSRVQILIEGTPHNTLVGHVDIRGPFRKNPEIIKKP
ncbi:MAG TPA: hypothetical protein ENL39_01950 [Candidatus Aerophobetes bacterium]|uniref:GerMN domain-containing protein n=1 Tax=Aerophobetes bacterium TaxID=2030807 RepID=A0A7V5HYI0_UNCAE|nr:hypothetical protein [Candidatus Aerophobetes bacterium]